MARTDPGTGVENASPNPLKRRYSLVGGKAAQQALEKLSPCSAMSG
jgi:hypothetical protein